MTSPSRFDARFGDRGIAFVSILFLMIFAAAAMAAIYASLEPGNRTFREDLTEKRFATLKTAVALFKTHSGGSWPANLDLMVNQGNQPACAIDTNASNASTYRKVRGWCGPYIDLPFSGDTASYLKDGYGTNFVYNSGNGTVQTCGKDRICGGGSNAADDRTLSF